MRKQLFMYLFLFAALYIVFQYMNAKKAYQHMDELEAKVEALKNENSELSTKIEDIEAKNDSLANRILDLNYFSLTENNAARSYFRGRGLDVYKIAADIKDEIIGRNQANEDNNLVPFPGMVGNMRVNHIEILNHRWIIADFTDGIYWGEVLLKYRVDDEGNLSFSTIETFMYPGRR